MVGVFDADPFGVPRVIPKPNLGFDCACECDEDHGELLASMSADCDNFVGEFGMDMAGEDTEDDG